MKTILVIILLLFFTVSCDAYFGHNRRRSPPRKVYIDPHHRDYKAPQHRDNRRH